MVVRKALILIGLYGPGNHGRSFANSDWTNNDRGSYGADSDWSKTIPTTMAVPIYGAYHGWTESNGRS